MVFNRTGVGERVYPNGCSADSKGLSADGIVCAKTLSAGVKTWSMSVSRDGRVRCWVDGLGYDLTTAPLDDADDWVPYVCFYHDLPLSASTFVRLIQQ